eukprot:12360791-Heterocapsa_arctica.AAC.1
MGIGQQQKQTTGLEHVCEADNLYQAQILVQTYKRSARNLTMIARTPEDRSKVFENNKHLQKPSRPYT